MTGTPHLTVLMVEDVPSDQALIVAAITAQLGAETTVRIAGSVRDGLALLQTSRFDAILLDLALPDSDGIATVAAFNASAADTPIIVLSGGIQQDDAQLAVRIGAEDVIAKDDLTARTGTLGHTVRAALDRRRRTEYAAPREPTHGQGGSLSVLVVEDDPASAVLTTEMVDQIAERNHWVVRTHVASDLVELPALVEAEGTPDIALLDLSLPSSTGLATLARVIDMMPSTSVIVLSGEERDTQAMAALDLGAADVLVKDWTDVRVLHRAMVFGLQRRRQQRRTEMRLLHDGLTGLPSRSLVISEITQSMNLLRSGQGVSVAVAFLGLDGVAMVNEQFGHAAGDLVMGVVAARLRAAARPEDTIGRVGADAFVLLAQDTSREDFALVVGRMAAAVATPIALGEGSRISVTLSTGAEWTSTPQDPEELLDRADRRMYEGRRRRLSSAED